jgi:serine/threonine protein kinase
MERSQTLSDVRGDSQSSANNSEGSRPNTDDEFLHQRSLRFPTSFIASTPENAQRIILWCLEREPTRRPTAQELLKVKHFFVEIVTKLSLISLTLAFFLE